MPCYKPLTAYRSRAGRDSGTGKWPIVFNRSLGYTDMELQVPCGQCIGCRLERSRQWAIRCLHEASLHDENCFITLTYDDAHLPPNGSLNKRDMVLFLKRLRKQFGAGIRFFQCGEYGDMLQRPHHHAIIFGFDFPDKVFLFSSNGFPVYTSVCLRRLWPHGISSVAGVSFESAAYVARYITKKITGDLAAEHYRDREPEYVTMSRRPGIAREWFERFHADVFNNDSCVVRPGLVARPPRYYDKLFDLLAPDEMAKIKYRRLKRARELFDNTPGRLHVREKCKLSQLKMLKRKFENPVI